MEPSAKQRQQSSATGGHDDIADISIEAPNSSTGGFTDRKHTQRTQKQAPANQTQKNKTFDYKNRQVAIPGDNAGNRQLSLMNTVKGNFIALKYKTSVAVEGMGEYQIEIVNVVNTRTFKERQVVPSLMNMANYQRIEANRAKRIMQQQLKSNP